jgi:hypothetical protein
MSERTLQSNLSKIRGSLAACAETLLVFLRTNQKFKMQGQEKKSGIAKYTISADTS